MVQHAHAVNLSKQLLEVGDALFCLVHGQDGYHSPGGISTMGLGPLPLPLASKWVKKSPPLRYSFTISRVSSISIAAVVSQYSGGSKFSGC